MTLGSRAPMRPTSAGSLTAVRWASFTSSVSAGLAIGAGTLPNAWAAGGVNVTVAITAAFVVATLLAIGWHVLLGFAAHARQATECSLAIFFGSCLSLVGIATSAWFLAALLGGGVALQSWQRSHLDQLSASLETVSANAAADQQLVGTLQSSGANLEAVATAESSTGVVSGRLGCKAVCVTLKNAAAALVTKSAALAKQQQVRGETLAQAREAIGQAVRASAINDASAFEDQTARATHLINAADALSLTAPDLAAGLDAGPAREPITRTMREIGAIIDDAKSRRRSVVVPVYQPIDTKTAIVNRPQPLAWIAAIVIEVLPALLLGLLLTLWRDETMSRAPMGEVHPFRPRGDISAAE